MGMEKTYLAVLITLCAATYTIFNAIKETGLRRSREASSPESGCATPQDVKDRAITGSQGDADRVIISINIIFATEWGTCEKIAETLCERLQQWPCLVQTLAIEDYNIEECAKAPEEVFSIFIASTVGQGEAPANAQKFMRMLKKKLIRIPSGMVVGVGHSAFETYNSFGIDLHRQLVKKGGMKSITSAPVLIDCADPRYEERALEAVLAQSEKICAMINLEKAAIGKTQRERQQIEFVVRKEELVDSWPAQECGKPAKVADKPLFEASWCVVSDRKCAKSDDRKLHLLRLSCPKLLDVTVGHAVRIWTPASEVMVRLAFRIFGEYLDGYRLVDQSPPPANGKFLFPKGMTIADIFRYVIDWTAVPSEGLMREILGYCGTTSYVEELIGEVGRRGATLREFLEYLHDNHGPQLPLGLLGRFPRIKARVYTIASSVTKVGVRETNFELLISDSMTKRTTPSLSTDRLVLPSVHVGRVTSWLQRLDSTECEETEHPVLVATAPSTCSLRHAVHGGVWCGAGSGVSLFRAFIDERKRTFQRIKRTPPAGATTCVYLSLRTLAEYTLINSEATLELAIKEGLVKEIVVCLTREPGYGLSRVTEHGLEPLLSEKVSRPYVGDALRLYRPSSLSWLLEGAAGHFIICGGVWLKENIASALEPGVLGALSATGQLVTEVW